MSLVNLNSIVLILQSIPLGFSCISNTLGFFPLCMNIFSLCHLSLRQLVSTVGQFFFKVCSLKSSMEWIYVVVRLAHIAQCLCQLFYWMKNLLGSPIKFMTLEGEIWERWSQLKHETPSITADFSVFLNWNLPLSPLVTF